MPVTAGGGGGPSPHAGSTITLAAAETIAITAAMKTRAMANNTAPFVTSMPLYSAVME